MLRLSRVGAVVKGLLSAATGQGGCFALLVDCHLEVEEDFTIIDRVMILYPREHSRGLGR